MVFGCLDIQFFDSIPFPQHSRLDFFLLPNPHCAALVWLIGHHAIPLVIKCIPPREVENSYRGGKHSKHVPLLTYLDWLQPIINNTRLISEHVKIKYGLLVLKTLIRKTQSSNHINKQSRISNHFNQLPKLIKNSFIKKCISKYTLQYCSLKKWIWKLL